MAAIGPLLTFLSSMRFGLLLFGAVALVSMAGSFLPAWADGIYGSWPFALLIGALVFNTGLCTARQTPRFLRGKPRFKVLYLVHVSVLLVSLACAWAAIAFTTTSVMVAEGQQFAVGGTTWRLDRVEVQRYADGMVSDWVSTVSSPDGRREIRVNHPLAVGDDKILQSSYARMYRVRLEAGSELREIELQEGMEIPLSADGGFGFALAPPAGGSQAELLLTANGRVLSRVGLTEGVSREIGDTGLRLTVLGSTGRSGFLVRHTPGLALVWAGMVMLALSITILMLMPRARLEEIANA